MWVANYNTGGSNLWWSMKGGGRERVILMLPYGHEACVTLCFDLSRFIMLQINKDELLRFSEFDAAAVRAAWTWQLPGWKGRGRQGGWHSFQATTILTGEFGSVTGEHKECDCESERDSLVCMLRTTNKSYVDILGGGFADADDNR